jgi:hypothetical protein
MHSVECFIKTLTTALSRYNRSSFAAPRAIALGQRAMRRLGDLRWTQTQTGLMTVEVNGCVLTFSNDSNKLDYCNSCYSSDGREYIFDSSQRFGTDPLELLSTWEHGQHPDAAVVTM